VDTYSTVSLQNNIIVIKHPNLVVINWNAAVTEGATFMPRIRRYSSKAN